MLQKSKYKLNLLCLKHDRFENDWSPPNKKIKDFVETGGNENIKTNSQKNCFSILRFRKVEVLGSCSYEMGMCIILCSEVFNSSSRSLRVLEN